MSKFSYDKVGQYGAEVVDKFIINKGLVKAIDGKSYTIDISKNSVFDKFKSLVNKGEFRKLQPWLKENEFEVLKPKDRDKKFEGLGWTEIEKSVFSTKTIKIETAQQEKITLLIIKSVLGDNTKTWKSFAEMFHAKNSPIKKIFPDLPKLKDWWANFELQFQQIGKVGKFPNSSYGVYLYEEPGNFMDYISKLIVKDLNLYSKKDSWNPADIWLIKSLTIQKDYIKKFDKIKENLDEGKYADDPFQSIREINLLLKKAYNKKDIVGISLKKSDGKTLKYQEFNLQTKLKDQKLPNVKFRTIDLDCTYDKKSSEFTSKTSQVYVDDGDRGAYKLGFKSNTGSGIGNITYEFLPDGPAAAFLGKVPKDKLKDWLKEQINKKVKNKMVSENVEMPQGVLLDKKWNAEVERKWEAKIKFIKKMFKVGKQLNATALDEFVANLKDSYKKVGLHGKNASMQQMVDFVWIMAKLRDNKTKNTDNLTVFLTLCYYFAQKKGQIYNFGPFAKVY
ncbi:MAG: hypothetical protein H8E55_33710 [Pelagibacterales bacterium]|nr:hypothetical protein [Pelagibacterales bacterium]